MAIVVDKKEKRRNIALACRELLFEKGIANLTISQIAEAAGVGKGTIYEYFENKEDIVFEIFTIFIGAYQDMLRDLADSDLSTREKLFRFCYVFFENEEGRKQLELYREFVSIALVNDFESMLLFGEQTRGSFMNILDDIIQSGISKGELSEKFANLATSIVVFRSGLMVDSKLKSFDVEHELNLFLDMFFDANTTGDNK